MSDGHSGTAHALVQEIVAGHFRIYLAELKNEQGEIPDRLSHWRTGGIG